MMRGETSQTPGPIITKAISSAPEGYGSQGPDGIGGYVTESEAVSDLIGSTALIAGLTDSLYNGRFCRIEAFDPQVRRYVVRVYTEEGPVNAKLRLENLILQSFALPSFPAPASFQEFQTALPCQPEAFLNPYNPWAWPPSLAFQDFQDASNAMLMQTLPQPWGPMGETPWSQYGIPSMLGAEIPMDGSHMLPSLPPSMPTFATFKHYPCRKLAAICIYRRARASSFRPALDCSHTSSCRAATNTGLCWGAFSTSGTARDSGESSIRGGSKCRGLPRTGALHPRSPPWSLGENRRARDRNCWCQEKAAAPATWKT